MKKEKGKIRKTILQKKNPSKGGKKVKGERRKVKGKRSKKERNEVRKGGRERGRA